MSSPIAVIAESSECASSHEYYLGALLHPLAQTGHCSDVDWTPKPTKAGQRADAGHFRRISAHTGRSFHVMPVRRRWWYRYPGSSAW
ncbi:MAG: hypothetical protein KGI33_12405 [Thaumarchaeota archaeon]|nr:hypothetical protein [Nitrososphaerota archaeon]